MTLDTKDTTMTRDQHRPPTRNRCGRRFMMSCACLSLVLLTGCFELETRIQYNTNGSATITERLNFSQRLLDLGRVPGSETPIADLLLRPAVEARMKLMGQGIRLASHETRDGAHGSRESIAVFEIADANEFHYASPFLAYTDYPENNIVKMDVAPMLKSGNYAGMAGDMKVVFRPVAKPKPEVRLKEGEKPPPDATPLELQAVRDLQPLMRTLLKDFRLRLTFESYAPISATGFGLRDRKAGTNKVDLIAITDRDLDRWGVRVWDNEEILLDILRGRFGSPIVVETVKEFQDNTTVPIFLPWGAANAPWRQGDEICFKSSRELFDKHFQGKLLDFDRWQSTGKNIRPAAFGEVGWTPQKKAMK